jgi:hypothetical protein
LVKLPEHLRNALLMIMGFVAHATGAEPSQEEVAAALRSYFTLDEVTNQISYLRNKPGDADTPSPEDPGKAVAWRINLAAGPPKNSMARAGYFSQAIADGIEAIRRHAKAMLGESPSDEELARSLRSSFILSELKNQIVHYRSTPRKRS